MIKLVEALPLNEFDYPLLIVDKVKLCSIGLGNHKRPPETVAAAIIAR